MKSARSRAPTVHFRRQRLDAFTQASSGGAQRPRKSLPSLAPMPDSAGPVPRLRIFQCPEKARRISDSWIKTAQTKGVLLHFIMISSCTSWQRRLASVACWRHRPASKPIYRDCACPSRHPKHPLQHAAIKLCVGHVNILVTLSPCCLGKF